MAQSRESIRRRMLVRLLCLWNLVPDDSFAKVVSDVFEIKDGAIKLHSDDKVFELINDTIRKKAGEIYQTKLHTTPPTRADNICAWREFSAKDYARAHTFLETLKQYSGVLSTKEYARLKRIALGGNMDAAKDELDKIMQDKENDRAMSRTK